MVTVTKRYKDIIFVVAAVSACVTYALPADATISATQRRQLRRVIFASNNHESAMLIRELDICGMNLAIPRS